MRTYLAIDDRLLARAMRASGAINKSEAVTRGLELLLALGGVVFGRSPGAATEAHNPETEPGPSSLARRRA
jgi:hypothetical protein